MSTCPKLLNDLVIVSFQAQHLVMNLVLLYNLSYGFGELWKMKLGIGRLELEEERGRARKKMRVLASMQAVLLSCASMTEYVTYHLIDEGRR